MSEIELEQSSPEEAPKRTMSALLHEGPTWSVLAAALAAILLGILGFMGANYANRLSVAESTIASRGERIALLEARTNAIDSQMSRMTEVMERISIVLQDMRIEHRELLQRQKGQAH